MAAAVDKAWPDVELCGVVSTRYGHAVPAGRVKVIEAGHPVPDDNSVIAAREMFDVLAGLTADDLVLALVSGGGSATLALPIDGLTLQDKQAITRSLLGCGAPIGEINAVRTQLSRIKGGGLARAAAPAQLCTLLISDVPGDHPAEVASGPTFPPQSTPQEAITILDRYGINLPGAVRASMVTAIAPEPIAQDHTFKVIASPSLALRAAADKAVALGLSTAVLGDCLEGESSTLGPFIADIATAMQSMNGLATPPAVLISGGETTVTIGPEGAGRGGRNTEFLLSLALALQGSPSIYALAADSDGIDGTEDAAGAIIAPDTLQRSRDLNLDAQLHLRQHDSYSFFDGLGDLVRTGPTLTNVNDIRLVLVA